MRFETVELQRYGRFADERLDFPKAECDFHVIIGANEAGKSTLRQAIRDLLFGIPMNSPMSFRHAATDLSLAATVSGAKGEFAFGRRRKRNDGLVDAQGSPLPGDALDDWLGGVNAAFFERMFGLDHHRLEQGSRAMLQAGDNVDSVLFQAAAGVAALSGVLAGLREEAAALWTPNHARTRAWYVAQARMNDAVAALKAGTVRPTAWAQQQRDTRKLEEAYEQAQAQHAALMVQSGELERLRRLAPLLAQIREYEEVLRREEAVLGRSDSPDTFTPALLLHEAEILRLDESRLRLIDHRSAIQECTSRLQLLQGQLQRVLRQAGRDMPAQAYDGEAALAALIPARPLRREVEQLLAEGRQLRAASDAATRLLDERRREVEALHKEIQALPATSASTELRDALDAATAAGDIAAQLEAARRNQERELAALERHLQMLAQPAVTVPGSLDESMVWLQGMMPWPLSAVSVQAQRRQALQNELETARKRGSEAQEAAESARLDADQFRRSRDAVSRDEVMAARRERDALWREISQGSAPLTEQAEHFASLMRGADALADRHLDAVGDAARLQAMEHEYERRALALQAQMARISESENALAAFDKAWWAECRQRQLPPLAPADMQAWLADREAVLPAHDRVVAARAEFERLEASHAALLDRLSAALEGVTHNAPISLAQACASARTLLKRADETAASRHALGAQLARVEQQIPVLEQDARRSVAARQEWRQRYEHALQRAQLPGDVDDTYILEALELFTNADSLADQMRQCREQHGQLVNEMQRFHQAVADLAVTLGMRAPAPAEAELQVIEWTKALASQRDAQRSRDDARVRLAQLNERLLQEGAGRSRAEIEAELAATDPSELALKLEALQAEMADAAATLSRLAVERDRARQNLEAISGGNAAALAEAQRQEALADMAEISERYVNLYIQYRLLERVTERYRERKQGPLLERAGQLFADLTLGSHSGLEIDGIEAVLYARRADGGLVELEGLSDGTRDQLYLALRLAALELYLDSASGLPFIADDLFINYDDARSAAGLRKLAGVARRTQVIFLTHHTHMVELARETLGGAVNVIELNASA